MAMSSSDAASSLAPHDVPVHVDVALVRELLESAARRHRKISEQVVEFGDDPTAAQYPVKDARKYDYALTPVTPRPRTAAPSSFSFALKAQQRRGSSVASSTSTGAAVRTAASAIETPGDQSHSNVATTSSSDTTANEPVSTESAWHNQLQLHVVHLLQKLRARPEQLRDFMLVSYEDESEASALRWHAISTAESEEDSGDDDNDAHASVAERLARRERVHKRRMGKNYAKLRFVFAQLHRVAVMMGEQLFEQVRSMVRRSVTAGILTRQANLVRLESIYKLELRRQVTTEKLLEAVRAQDAERKRKRRRKKRDEMHVRTQTLRRKTRMLSARGDSKGVAVELVAAAQASAGNNEPVEMQQRALQPQHSLWDRLTEPEATKSAHAFKMHALERVLAAEWPDSEARRGAALSFRGSLLSTQQQQPVSDTPRLVSEQTEELIHEKLTALLYNKHRDAFPVWREPPESAFTRDETLRLLKRALPVLLTTALFASLSIDHVIEFARATKWRSCVRGTRVVVQGANMDELLVVMDGSLDRVPPLAKAPSKSEPRPVVDDAPLTATDAAQLNRSDQIVHATSDAAAAPPASSLEPQPAVPIRPIPVCLGELGMLSKTDVWPATLFAKTTSVKLLVLSRAAFDVVLHKLFGSSGSGGTKSRQALAAVQQQQRPSSSPAASARGSGGVSVSSSVRPSTAASVVAAAAARERYVAMTMDTREERASHEVEHTLERPLAPKQAQQSDASTSQSSSAPTQQPRAPTASRPMKHYSGSTLQHFPTFDATTRADGSAPASSIAHTFRLKWAQPIAFEMASLDASVFDEWAPSLPDTSAMVDFLSSSSLASTCRLFEKRNVLLKHHLQSVCFHHEFLGSTTRPRLQKSSAGTGTTTGVVSPDTTSSSGAANPESNSSGTNESGAMTLAQFSEARKKASSNSGSRRQLLQSSSMQNLLPGSPSSSSASTSATAMKLSHVPFSRSSFVSESSFVGARRRGKPKLSPNHEGDDDEERESDDVDSNPDGEFDAVDPDASLGAAPSNAGLVTTASPRHLDDTTEHDGTAKRDPESETTRARKMALESLMTSLTPARKSKVLDQDTSKGVLVAKYLKASHAAGAVDNAPSPRSTNKQARSSTLRLPESADAMDSSHAPLPLRVDLQRRMETVLSALRMTPKSKLALVLKYTHAAHYDRFQLAVVLWEQALRYITKRERALAQLWQFELVASDPRRHFRSLSTHRLTEQKQRDALFSQLRAATDTCRKALAELTKTCGDTVYVDDRTYADKMAKDYTELLYDVEQERLRMIYSDVRPAVAAAESNVDGSRSSGDLARDSDDDDDEFDTSARAEQPTTPVSRRRKPSMVPEQPANNSNNNNAGDCQSLHLAGAATAMDTRHRLANPQESIYVCIASQREQEAQRQCALQETQETHRRRSSHGATHRMAMRVQLERQAELQALTDRLQTAKRADIPRDDVQPASTVVAGPVPEVAAPPSDLALLQRALHRFIHRPKD